MPRSSTSIILSLFILNWIYHSFLYLRESFPNQILLFVMLWFFITAASYPLSVLMGVHPMNDLAPEDEGMRSVRWKFTGETMYHTFSTQQ
jgi:hypothetical protein